MIFGWKKKSVEDASKKIREKRDFIGLLCADARMLAERCEDASARRVFLEYAEAVRFSDPMSAESLFTLEAEIQLKTAEAAEALAAGQNDQALSLVREARALLKERNEKCIALK